MREKIRNYPIQSIEPLNKGNIYQDYDYHNELVDKNAKPCKRPLRVDLSELIRGH